MKAQSTSRTQTKCADLEVKVFRSERIWKRKDLEAKGFGSERIWKRTDLEANGFGSERIWKRKDLEANGFGSERIWKRNTGTTLTFCACAAELRPRVVHAQASRHKPYELYEAV